MGITCRQIGKFKGIMTRLENKIMKEEKKSKLSKAKSSENSRGKK